MGNTSNETKGKLKKLANALKPLKMPFMAMLVIWAISGMAAVVFFTQWVYVTILLVLLTMGIAMIIDYQESREKKKGASK